MMEFYVMDALENGMARLENSDGKMLTVKAEMLPKGAKAGDCLRKVGSGWAVDQQETAARRERLRALRRSLTKNK